MRGITNLNAKLTSKNETWIQLEIFKNKRAWIFNL